MANDDPAFLPERWRLAYQEYAKAEHAADMAEEWLKVVEAECFEREEGPQEQRKMAARSSNEYRRAVADKVSKKTAMRMQWAEVKAIELQIEVFRTLESSRRAEMGMR